LLLAVRVPSFTRRAKRRVTAHPKFYFFDAGVFRTLRPRGPLDAAEEIEGAALETLVLQEIRALNDYLKLGHGIHYWRTASGHEVDFVLYGERGLTAIEVKRTSTLRGEDYSSLGLFLEDYPMAKAWLVHAGHKASTEGALRAVPAADFLKRLPEILGG
jgi:predicted AAA+ superfamily ATPase